MHLDRLLLFHFTHYKNIPMIKKYGLIADSFLAENEYRNSGNIEIKQRRKLIHIKNNITVGDCVPFYFATRSPMLYSQYYKNIIKQNDIVYIVCLLHKLVTSNYTWFCSNINAACFDAEFISDSNKIMDHVDINVVNYSRLSPLSIYVRFILHLTSIAKS